MTEENAALEGQIPPLPKPETRETILLDPRFRDDLVSILGTLPSDVAGIAYAALKNAPITTITING